MTDSPAEISFYHAGNNATLITKVAQLGYIKPDDVVLDMTYGRGRWWTEFRPVGLVTNDVDPATDAEYHYDYAHPAFVALFGAAKYDVVCFDPPYQLGGTHYGDDVNERYGVASGYTSASDRLNDMALGAYRGALCLRPEGIMLLKCQAQVSGGKVVWQDRIMADRLALEALELVDRFDMPPARPQPTGRRQLHARRGSTLLVFKKGKP